MFSASAPWWRGERDHFARAPRKTSAGHVDFNCLGILCVHASTHWFDSATCWGVRILNCVVTALDKLHCSRTRMHALMYAHTHTHTHTHQCRYVHVAISVLCRTELSERSD